MDLTQGKIDAVIVDPITGGSRYISEAIQERKDQIRDDMTIGEKFSDLVSRGERYGDEDRTRFNDPAELIGKRVPSYEDRRREGDPRYEELFRMRDEYKSEMDRNSGLSGLMSLLRGTGDMVLGEDIMNNLPELLRAFEGTNLGTQESLRDISRPMETEGFALELSTTPGLESLVGPEMGLALGALGGGGKGKTFKELIEEIIAAGKRMDSNTPSDYTGLSSRMKDLDKGFSDIQQERQRGLGSLKQELGDQSDQEALLRRQTFEDDTLTRLADADRAKRLQKAEVERLRDIDPDRMAGGGRPGLYANINAKRKRIAAGSGERMRKKGEKGAPTAANFRESAKTAKKANGGGLNYMKGYYGKSYK